MSEDMNWEQTHGVQKVLDEVMRERERQHEKWGEQNHPDLCASPAVDSASSEQMVEATGVISAQLAKQRCQNVFANGFGDYTHIAVEEVAEALEAAAKGDTRELRMELVQCAAVFVAWIESIDRRALALRLKLEEKQPARQTCTCSLDDQNRPDCPVHAP